MILAVEKWFLRPELAGEAVRIMQEVDDFSRAHELAVWVEGSDGGLHPAP